MSTYPRYVNRAAYRAAERLYRRLEKAPVPHRAELDDHVDRSLRDGSFIPAAPQERDDDD